MKIVYFLIPLFLASACKTPTETVNTSEKNPMELLKNSTTGCPENGTCEVVVHRNKELKIIDEGNGQKYSDIVEGENIVVEYTYLKPAPEGIADGNYFETIQFEVPAGTNNLVKENAALTDVKMIFGKHGFRNASYYPVTEGKLTFQKINKDISFNLKFKIKETDQVVWFINETAKME